MNLSTLKVTAFIAALLLTATSCQQKTCDKPIQMASDEEIVLANIHNRTSVREFTDQKPEEQTIDKLLKAAMAAPSGKDQRPWEFLVIDDREILNKLAEGLPHGKMLSHAPMAIIVCGDTTKSSYWFLDCALASQNILLAAQSIGLGATYTAAYPYRERMDLVKKNINMPSSVLPLNVIPVGYPKTEKEPKEKYDPTRIHINKW